MKRVNTGAFSGEHIKNKIQIRLMDNIIDRNNYNPVVTRGYRNHGKALYFSRKSDDQRLNTLWRNYPTEDDQVSKIVLSYGVKRISYWLSQSVSVRAIARAMQNSLWRCDLIEHCIIRFAIPELEKSLGPLLQNITITNNR